MNQAAVRTRLFLLFLLVAAIPATLIAQTARFGGPDADLGYEIEATPDGGFIAVGFTEDVNLIDGFVVKADADGNSEWQRALSLSPLSEIFYDVVLASDGGFLLVGSANLPETGGDYRPWLVKLAADGETVWTSAEAWTSEIDVDSGIVRGVELPDGRLAIMGAANTMTNPEDPWLLLVSADGELLSSQTFATLGTPGFGVATYIQDLIATPDGGFAATGYVTGGLSYGFLWKFDAEGEPEWDRLYGPEGLRAAEAALALADGGFALIGCDLPNCNRTFVLRSDAGGEPLWFNAYEDPGGEYTNGHDALEAADGRLFVAQSRFSAFGSSQKEADLLEITPDGALSNTASISVGETSTVLYRLTPTSDGFLGVGSVNDSSDPNAIDLLVLRNESETLHSLHGDGFESGDFSAWTANFCGLVECSD